MAYHHFRFANSTDLQTNFRFPLINWQTPHTLDDSMSYLNDTTVYLPQLHELWATDSTADLVLTDAQFHPLRTLKQSHPSYTARPDFMYLDNDFNLPKGFLLSHPTVSSVLACDTKLLPNNPVAPRPYLAQFKDYFRRPLPTSSLQQQSVSDYDIYTQVIKHNRPNYIGAKLDLNPQFPVKTWDDMFASYPDKQIVEFMRFGWPTSFMGDQIPILSLPNHASSIHQPDAVQSFLNKEVSLKGLAGPFTESPFEWLRSNPMMTREKKQSDEYRVILDLSFPEECINSQTIIRGSAL